MAGALQDQHAFITGGGSGIGLGCAHAFIAEGAAVTLFGRSKDKLSAAEAELGKLGDVYTFSGDVGQEADVKAAVEQAHGRKPLTIAIANAGTGSLGPIVTTEDESWQQIMQTNLSGTFYTFKHAGAAIVQTGGGAMCAISSIAGVRTHRYMAPYCTSKAAIDMLVRNTADELGMAKVRVNSVCPGLVETDISQGLRDSETVHNDYLDCMPIRRVGVVDDIANAVRFLCGPESTWITGINLSVDGGHHLRRGPNVDPLAELLYGEKITTAG